MRVLKRERGASGTRCTARGVMRTLCRTILVNGAVNFITVRRFARHETVSTKHSAQMCLQLRSAQFRCAHNSMEFHLNVLKRLVFFGTGKFGNN